MVILTVKDMHIKTGQELTICGKVKNPCERFEINIGNDLETLGLHFNPRYNYNDDKCIIVCNSRKNGSWGEEQRSSTFPFQPNENFQVTINFSPDQFYIKLPDGTTMTFPNRLDDCCFEYIGVEGDAEVHSFKIT